MIRYSLGRTMDSFAAYRPSRWNQNKRPEIKANLAKRPVQKRGIDLLKFIQTGIVAAGVLVGSGEASAFHSTQAAQTHVLEFSLPQAYGSSFLDRSIEIRQQIDHTPLPQLGRVKFTPASQRIVSFDIMPFETPSTAAVSWYLVNDAESTTSNPASTHATRISQTTAHVQTLFTPTEKQHAKIQEFTSELVRAGIGNILAFENELGDLVIEAGQPARTLTFIIKQNRILAMYRVKQGDDHSEMYSIRLPAIPSVAEISAITGSYLNTSWLSLQT